MKKLVFVGLMLGACSAVALADTTCATGATNSFAGGVTLNLSGSCSIGTVTFSNFQVFGANSFVPTSMSALVTIFSASPNTLSFSYSNLNTSDGSSSSGVGGVGDIRFTFQTDKAIPGMILGGGTSSAVTEIVCGTALVGENCNTGTLGFASVTNGGTTTIFISAFNGGEFFLKDIAGGSGVNQTVTPEPMSFSMMGLGLLGVGVLARRRKA